MHKPSQYKTNDTAYLISNLYASSIKLTIQLKAKKFYII